MWGVALYQHGFDIPTGGSTHIIYYAGGNTSYMNAYYVGSSDDSDLGTSGTAITGAMCSSATTLRMYFQYRA